MTGMNGLLNDEVPVLDVELFRELHESLGSDLAVVAGIYRRFIDNADRSVEASRGQAGAERASTLHTLKGSAAMVGARRIAALAAHLQESLPGAAAEAVDLGLRELAAAVAAFRPAVAAHLESLGYQK